ncbi:hypothetical protein LO772_27365 [Yinghuangia sp. ASG 101]|uniref:hypothetical protein n=1 Tax=Yinghuangia sp. ASG 101 TaxID=2896848 RepID=UPI001E5AED85|nr:hypothetical protein [Yinghuangia sp. ASG 101]UGQ10534.1 hypothetical protein LO772_27365 [Yinghuangia sp. ASG 101]
MGECRHVIAHWTTEAERQEIVDAIDYARRIGDVAALPLLIARLTAPCSARDGQSPALWFQFLAYRWDVGLARQLAATREVAAFDPRPWFGWLDAVRVDDPGDPADWDRPVVVVRIGDAGNSPMIIDGWHRVARARDDGSTSLPVVVLDADDEFRVRIFGGDKTPLPGARPPS